MKIKSSSATCCVWDIDIKIIYIIPKEWEIKRTPYISLNYDDIGCINQLIQMARSKLSLCFANSVLLNN